MAKTKSSFKEERMPLTNIFNEENKRSITKKSWEQEHCRIPALFAPLLLHQNSLAPVLPLRAPAPLQSPGTLKDQPFVLYQHNTHIFLIREKNYLRKSTILTYAPTFLRRSGDKTYISTPACGKKALRQKR